jgi:hypothetical protein
MLSDGAAERAPDVVRSLGTRKVRPRPGGEDIASRELTRQADARNARGNVAQEAKTDSLTTRLNRAYAGQRALCEDPVLIRSRFELVEQTKTKYGIFDEDVYNFDKAGFNHASTCHNRLRKERHTKGYPAWQSRGRRFPSTISPDKVVLSADLVDECILDEV